MALLATRRLLSVTALSIALVAGCASPERFRTASQPGGKFLVHVVSTEGETLKQVSDWYSQGKGGEKAISAANPGQDLSSLKVGDRILIPYSVVKRVEPLGPGLPRPEGKEQPEDTPVPEEQTSTRGPLDEDFVDLPEKGSETPAPKPPKPQEEQTPKPPAEKRAPERNPKRTLDPLEELAVSTEKSQRQLPPGVPVGAGQDQSGVEAFDLGQEGAEPVGQPQKSVPAPATTPEAHADPEVDELRRDLGLTR